MLRIGVVVGEASGDTLGAALMCALQQRIPNVEFVGIGGPKMVALGCNSLYPMERLSVMGISEVFGRLRELLSIRADLVKYFIADPPDLFIGIDAPDFNLTLERKLRERGIKTAHYVSPSVWAWRQGRVRKIARSVDLMLTLFPFESAFYESHSLPVRFVGHPLADQIPLEVDRHEARERLGLPAEASIISLLPGSRMSEVSRLSELFIATANWCDKQRMGLKFVVPLANTKIRTYFETVLKQRAPGLEIELFDGQASQVMAASDAVLLASGTASLEAMLINRPMVVAYRLAKLTNFLLYGIGMLKSKYVSLPNLLADSPLVEEFIQDAATPDSLGGALLRLLDSEIGKKCELAQQFNRIHQSLRLNASESAADALLELMHS
ncbi:lipid-A-disaccharide synthase [Solemya pervernicosa gill symbiont]|uniref:Lipid-A-disaccharide synthase n=2 Tax=Gammaproteobacteria incertae sedis TaxID=118884 RepID=A0A1T2L7Y5_9GAMM|nr:lipid-A-disaccharide synthase [Candidatus Reidiella endopervernicosa]OOZ41193.1 lipid-A-disaccharide synthase [Solemya pervernicosa gill symbiont]QKQ27082.1 lipid-A-disaccharide synthase [Candidatus Reidiella endopervernicosa]